MYFIIIIFSVYCVMSLCLCNLITIMMESEDQYPAPHQYLLQIRLL